MLRKRDIERLNTSFTVFESDIQERKLALLSEVWGDLATEMGFDPSRVAMNNSVLAEVVASFFRHLGRYKNDHDIEYADRHKSGGFLMHWICRLKPVQILALGDGEEETCPHVPELLANEMFAIKVGIDCLSGSVDLANEHQFFFSLIQRLREQECPPQFLSSMLYLYERQRQVLESL